MSELEFISHSENHSFEFCEFSKKNRLFSQVPKRPRVIRVNLPDYPIWISGDRIACTRIVQNLLNNTIRYAKENADIVLTKKDSYALLSIRNPAPNLSQNDLDHLFDRFYTADKSRKNSGTGLGLYIVKTLLTKMKGEIVCVSLNNQILCIEVGFVLSS